MPLELGDPSGEFARVCEVLRSAGERAHVRVEEISPPSRLAPYAFAVSADVLASEQNIRQDEDIEELATGRLVLLFDPAAPPEWDGCYRMVSYIRAELETELGNDPMIGSVTWSWLTESLDDGECQYRHAGGTATRVLSESFGSLAGRPQSIDVELRASWTPIIPAPEASAAHLHAWVRTLRTVAGVPPLPEGVTAMPGLRR